MSDPVDDLDDRLRRAMATLDHQIPQGTFDTLAERTLARLDDPAFAEPLGEAANAAEDDLPASSSPGWKAVALSEPAKLAEVPGDVDELARARAMRESRAAHTNRASDPMAVPAAADPAAPLPGSRPRSNRRSIVMVIGLGLAAAAGATVFVSTRDKAQMAPEMAERARAVASQASPATTPAGPTGTAAVNGSLAGALSSTQPSDTVAAGSAAVPEPTGAAPGAGPAVQGDPGAPGGHVDQVAKIAVDVEPSVTKPVPAVRTGSQVPVTKGGTKAVPKKFKGGTGKDGFYGADGVASAEGKVELGKLGVDTGGSSGHGQGTGGSSQKLDKRASDSTSLSDADFQRGMRAIAARAQACVAGTNAVASVQLMVAPSGRVQKATVSGPLAGTPAGSCVERVVKTAMFPAWDGAAQSFSYEFALSD